MPRSGCSPIWFGRQLRSSRGRDHGYAEVDRRDAGQALGLLAFQPEPGAGEVDAFNLTEPCFGLGAGSAGQQVVLELVEAGQLFGLTASMGQRKHN